MTAHLRADDRILLLAIPSFEVLAGIARILMSGSLVGIGTRAEVDHARRQMAEFDNTMFIEADPCRVPWRDHYFTKILVPPGLEKLRRTAAAEWTRLLAPDGKIVDEGIDV